VAARVVSVNISERTGTRKRPVSEVQVLVGFGVEGDAHGGDWHRQVSLLAHESIDKARKTGITLSPGDFAENITTSGIHLWSLPIGTRLRVGAEVELEITQIGKECHQKCAIYYQAGDCIMPREGIFARVLEEGAIADGDPICFVDMDSVG
jgi:molybdopterin adenylyltransferase